MMLQEDTNWNQFDHKGSICDLILFIYSACCIHPSCQPHRMQDTLSQDNSQNYIIVPMSIMLARPAIIYDLFSSLPNGKVHAPVTSIGMK